MGKHVYNIFIGTMIGAIILLWIWTASAFAQGYDVPQWRGSSMQYETVVVDESPEDRLMALHAIAMTLTVKEQVSWNNTETGNHGYATINSRSGRCVVFRNVMFMQGQLSQNQTFTACRGGGNDNTWIIDESWMISSVTRNHQGNCMTRYMNARIDRGRMYSDNAVCHNTQTNSWNVEG